MNSESWRSIVNNLPKGQVARTITEDLKNPDVLYLGTEAGLFVTLDRGKSWQRLKANLPTVPIYEITLHPRDNAMLLATHGRSVWILDDLTPIQQFTRAQSAAAYLFETPKATQRRPSSERMREFEGDMKFLGKNPDEGAAFTYHLKAATKNLSLKIMDASGAIVREFSGDKVKDKTEAGMNTLAWDLRVEPLPPLPGQGGGGGGFFGGGSDGPYVLPGAYKASLMIDGREAASTNITVQGDPEIQIAEADRRAWYDASMKLHQMHGKLNKAIAAVTALNEQVTMLEKMVKENPNLAAPVKSAIEDFAKKLTPVKTKLGIGIGPNVFATGDFSRLENVRFQLPGVKSGVMNSTSLPTETQTRMLGEMQTKLDQTIDEANPLIGGLSGLYKLMAENNVYPSMQKPVQAISK